MFSSSIKSGESYNNLKKTIVILIIDYSLENLRKIEKTTSKWQIREAEYLREILTELFEIYIIEVPKIRKYGEPNRAIEKWLKFIENPEVIGMEDLESNEAMKKAKKVLEEISEDEKNNI